MKFVGANIRVGVSLRTWNAVFHQMPVLHFCSIYVG